MIYIKETFPDGQSVSIQVDGILDHESIPTLQEICDRHLEDGKKITLHLDGVLHISREGKEFLHHMQDRITAQGFQATGI